MEKNPILIPLNSRCLAMARDGHRQQSAIKPETKGKPAIMKDYSTNWTPEQVANELPDLYETEEQQEEKLAAIKLFNPTGGETWYLFEADKESLDAFCFATGTDEPEYGYINLKEMFSQRVGLGLRIERDKYYTPITVEKIKAQDPNVNEDQLELEWTQDDERAAQEFDEYEPDYGGVLDSTGNVHSDADPGL